MSATSFAKHPPFDSLPTLTGLDAGTLRLGTFEAQYSLLFQEALSEVSDGRISDEERARLDLAAATLGLDPVRVARVEAALRAQGSADAGRNPRDTLADVEDPSSFSRLSSAHISVKLEAAGRAQAISVTFEPMHEREDVETARLSPEHVRRHQDLEVLHHRYDAAERDDKIDAQWCTAAVLVNRGAATPEETGFYELHRTRAPPRPRAALTAEGWTRLFHPAQDLLTSAIFEVIAPAALLCRVAAMRADRSLVVIDERQRQDPATSTVSAVRALAWSAATLGLQTPPIFVAPRIDAGLELVAHVPPATRVGARMLEGQTATQLAFHAARHLTWFRGDHFVCTLVPTLADLCDLFVAALLIGAPELVMQAPASAEKSRPQLVAEALAPILESGPVHRLRDLVTEFAAQGGVSDLQTWAHAAGHSAGRAGLLLCGDLAAASEIVAKEPDGADRVRDLELFFASDAATELRERLGIAML